MINKWKNKGNHCDEKFLGELVRFHKRVSDTTINNANLITFGNGATESNGLPDDDVRENKE